MRLRIALVFGLVAAMAVGAMGLSQAGNGDKVTGGGQTDVSSEGGAGDTIAFVVQENPNGLAGQVQYIDREGGTGQGQTVYHGTPTCLEVEGKFASMAGVWRDTDGDGEGGTWEIVVEDNGAGAGQDMIAIVPDSADPQCGEDDDEKADGVLARGNVTVHPAP